jgi:hypothetical protein
VNRRAAAAVRPKGIRRLATGLAALVMAAAAITAPASLVVAGLELPAAVESAPPDTVAGVPAETGPLTTANEFFPESRDITDCIGVLEKPGCGSEDRGGWRQFAVLGVLVLGLTFVFGNIARGVRRRR